jgi:hypothetical protein
VKKFMIPCDFPHGKEPFPLYIGEASAGVHPLEQQAAWLWRERSGTIPQEVMDAFQKLADIALENGVSFEELCVYALGESSEAPAAQNSADGAVG